MLPRVHEYLLDSGVLLERLHDRRNLDEVGPYADDVNDAHDAAA